MLTERFDDAVSHARMVHAGQVRKGTTVPYLVHPLAVAALVLEHGGDEEQAIGALLHDALEDGFGRTSREEIERRFGPRVRAIVEGCTDGEPDPVTGDKEAWAPRKARYLERLREASADVLLVVACDKVHNARALVDDYRRDGAPVWQRFKGGRDGTLWYYRALVRAIGDGAGTAAPPSFAAAADELARQVDLLEQAVAEVEGLDRPDTP